MRFGKHLRVFLVPSSYQLQRRRIRVHNIALNPVDSPLYRIEAAAPGRIVGSDVAGVVDKVGEGVTKWKVGDKAAGLLQGGEFLLHSSV
jgi:NADPH:quinone reductase-like Zn-dependent oxidoreductase